MQPSESPAPLRKSQLVGLAVAFVLLGLVLWLAWLYPLFPTTPLGWVAVLGSGLAVALWAVVGAFTIRWLSKQQRHAVLFKVAGVVVALSLGVGVFAGAYIAREFVSKNFSYIGRSAL